MFAILTHFIYYFIFCNTFSASSHQADAASDKELVRALRVKLDRMKTECDRMTEELSEGEEQRSHLRRKYQLLKQELDDKVNPKWFSPKT